MHIAGRHTDLDIFSFTVFLAPALLAEPGALEVVSVSE